MTEIEEDVEQEIKLAQQMKDTCCDQLGKETNPAKAAEILHQIGLIYGKRSPGKVSLIKSAGLLNAAIVRNPLNVLQIKSDLCELCRHILQTANAKKQDADLVEKSKEVKISIQTLRNEVKTFLETNVSKIPTNATKEDLQHLKSQKVSAIKQINKTIAQEYKLIMKDLSQYCEDVMGKPPCQYAIAGMGSLAREEITPYSDFEHIILLFEDKKYKSYLEYFKWFSVIFHIVVLNVQETIIPSLNIASLNGKDFSLGDWFYDDVTPRGISFDGMMPHACKFPLGRQQHTKDKQFTTELIKPVSEMLEYFSSDADLQNGYHLADILTKTCFVFGNEDIFNQFVDGAQDYRDTKSQSDIISDIKNQVREDLNNFSTRFRLSELKLQHTINIKRLVYRSTTIFISALARKHNVSANSCFDIIDGMANNNQITQITAEKLKFAIAIACEMRLRVYTDKQSQCDNAIDLERDGIEKFLDIVGVACTINYFQIAYCLQCEVAKELNFTKLHFYSDPNLINITIGLAFDINNFTSFDESDQIIIKDLSKFNFDECIKKLEGLKGIDNDPRALNISRSSSSRRSKMNSKQIRQIADYLWKANIFDEAVYFYLQVFQTSDVDAELVNYRIGFCYNRIMHKIKYAEKYLNQALAIGRMKRGNFKPDRMTALTLHEKGMYDIALRAYERALTNLIQALEIYQDISFNLTKDKDASKTLEKIGHCHMVQHNYEEALTYLCLGLEIKRNTSPNVNSDMDIAGTLNEIGECHIIVRNYQDAKESFIESAEINQNVSSNVDSDRNVAEIFHNLGFCHAELGNYDEALTNLSRALEIKHNLTLNLNKDITIAITLCEAARVHEMRNAYDEALTNLNQGLDIFQNCRLNFENKNDNIFMPFSVGLSHYSLHSYYNPLAYHDPKRRYSPSIDLDKNIAYALILISHCHIYLHNCDKALINLNQALEFREATTLNADKDDEIAWTLSLAGYCHIDLDNYDKALSTLDRALKIYQNFTSNLNQDENIAWILNLAGYCHIRLHNYDEALSNLNRALEIRQKIFSNAGKERKIAWTLHHMGDVHMKQQKYDKALDYFNQALKIKRDTSVDTLNDVDLDATEKKANDCLSHSLSNLTV